MVEVARYQQGTARVVVSRDDDELEFATEYDDGGRSIVERSHVAVADFIAKGIGPWPWFDLGDRRNGVLQVLDALGVEPPPPWTEPLAVETLDLFERAHRGDTRVIELVAMGVDPDPVDRCGGSPLWYGVRSVSAGIVVALIDAGADAGRRIELSARGERFTTILHEIVRQGRTVALDHALANGVDPAPVDSEGATPMHVLSGDADHVNPQIVRSLVRAGATVNAAMPSGAQPIEPAARKVLPATVAAMIELGADPGRGLDALMTWWSITGAKFNGYRSADVCSVIDVLRAGGAEVNDGHLDRAAGASEVEAALRR